MSGRNTFEAFFYSYYLSIFTTLISYLSMSMQVKGQVQEVEEDNGWIYACETNALHENS